MDIYLVGGAVRNRLLGLPVTERDYVVVGATPDEMKRKGYQSVGKEFPVFLHPKTREEYALARTERKTGRGHTGFECSTEAVTLEEDLKRRDLTINAMAQADDETIIDPWGGMQDLKSRTLRHVSKAFSEDPLRVLRVARFAAVLSEFGFRIHESTVQLMQEMTTAGELDELAPERILQEFEKALASPAPQQFFDVVSQVNASKRLWPELSSTDVQRLAAFSLLSTDIDARFAALASGLTRDGVQSLCKRLRVPRRREGLARLVTTEQQAWGQIFDSNAVAIVDLLYRVDAIRQPDQFKNLNSVLTLLASIEAPDSAALLGAAWQKRHTVVAGIGASDVDPALAGPEVGRAIRAAQQAAIETIRD